MRVKHILVPVDFSPDAEQALDDATQLARTFQARLTLLHAIYIPVITEISLSAYTNELEHNAWKQLETFQRRGTYRGLQVDMQIRHGDPLHCIIKSASDLSVDLIVMGTRGRTGVPHFLLGSVAERVVRLAPCAVFVSRCPQDWAPLSTGILAFDV